jgi:hypothetical protein
MRACETTMTDSIRVVLADDHPVVRSGLSALLGSVPSITVAGVAAPEMRRCVPP